MPVNFDCLTIGLQYDRNYLASIWGYQDWHAISRGIVTPSHDNKVILFVTKIKQEANTQYVDYFEDELLHMEGERNHGSDSRIVNNFNTSDEIHLFYREIHHAFFTYYGRICLAKYSLCADEPSKFVFSTFKYKATNIAALVAKEETH